MSNIQYFNPSVAQMLKYHHNYPHWCMFFFSTSISVQRPPDIHLILNEGAEAHWAQPGKFPPSNFAPRKKKHKSLQATQTRLETFSLVKVLQYSQRTLFPASIKLQLPIHELSTTHHCPAPLLMAHQCSHVTSPFTLTSRAAHNSAPVFWFALDPFEQLRAEEQKAALPCSPLAHAQSRMEHGTHRCLWCSSTCTSPSSCVCICLTLQAI